MTELWKSTAAAFAAVPPAVYGAILLVVAIIVAMVVHRMLLAAARRALAARHPEAHALLTRMQGPLLLALVLLAVSLELPMLPFDPDLRGTIGRILQLAFICLAGWMTFVCLDVSSAIYLRRFDLGAEDNLLARKHVTQVRVLKRTLNTLIVLITVAAALMTFDSVRQFGIGLFASAGIAGIVVGLAARPVLSNLLAGVQIAVTQPIRIDDSVVVENESGRIEVGSPGTELEFAL